MKLKKDIKELTQKKKVLTESLMQVMKKNEIEEISDEYELVGTIEAKDFEQAFTIGNIWAEDKIEVVGDMRSVSVGDILEDLATGVTMVVERYGFSEIVMKEEA